MKRKKFQQKVSSLKQILLNSTSSRNATTHASQSTSDGAISNTELVATTTTGGILNNNHESLSHMEISPLQIQNVDSTEEAFSQRMLRVYSTQAPHTVAAVRSGVANISDKMKIDEEENSSNHIISDTPYLPEVEVKLQYFPNAHTIYGEKKENRKGEDDENEEEHTLPILAASSPKLDVVITSGENDNSTYSQQKEVEYDLSDGSSKPPTHNNNNKQRQIKNKKKDEEILTHIYGLDQFNDYGFEPEVDPEPDSSTVSSGGGGDNDNTSDSSVVLVESITGLNKLKKEDWIKEYRSATIQRKRTWEFSSNAPNFFGSDAAALNTSHAQLMKDLKRHIRQGIPADWRGRSWYICSGAHRRQVQKSAYFSQLLSQAQASQSQLHQVATASKEEEEEEDENKKRRNKTFRDIEKDLDRTFPRHPLFQHPGGLAALKHVLTAFALHKPDIGYCQSMNFIVATLLLFYGENTEKTFWVLDSLVEYILPIEYYTYDMIGVQTDMYVLKHLLAKKFPDLSQLFKERSIDITIICTSWFLTLYVNILPFESMLRVWDSLFLEGDKILFRIALALFKINSSILLTIEDTGSLFHCLQAMGSDQFDCDNLMNVAFHGIGSLGRSKIAKLRAKYRVVVENQLRQVQQMRERLETIKVQRKEALDESSVFVKKDEVEKNMENETINIEKQVVNEKDEMNDDESPVLVEYEDATQ